MIYTNLITEKELQQWLERTRLHRSEVNNDNKHHRNQIILLANLEMDRRDSKRKMVVDSPKTLIKNKAVLLKRLYNPESIILLHLPRIDLATPHHGIRRGRHLWPRRDLGQADIHHAIFPQGAGALVVKRVEAAWRTGPLRALVHVPEVYSSSMDMMPGPKINKVRDRARLLFC